MKRIKRNQTLNLEQDGARIGIIIYNLRVETRIRGDRTQSWDMDKFQGIHRYLGIQISGYPGIWVYKYLGIQVSGYPSIWVSRYQSIQVSGYVSLYSGIWISRYLGSLGSRYLGIQVSRYLGIKLSWYLGILKSTQVSRQLHISGICICWYLGIQVPRYPIIYVSRYLGILVSISIWVLYLKKKIWTNNINKIKEQSITSRGD